MARSPIYRNAVLYELAMRLLYRSGYRRGQEADAELVPSGVSVLEVCSGPGRLYEPRIERSFSLAWRAREGLPLAAVTRPRGR
jgi:hypothetical protein